MTKRYAAPPGRSLGPQTSRRTSSGTAVDERGGCTAAFPSGDCPEFGVPRTLPGMTMTAATARAVGTVTLKPFRQRYWLPIVGSLVAAVVPVYATAFEIGSTGGNIVPVTIAAGVT